MALLAGKVNFVGLLVALPGVDITCFGNRMTLQGLIIALRDKKLA
jgi:hypothetical protein